VIRVLLAEDQSVVRGALAALLALEEDLDVVAQVDRGDVVAAAAGRVRPDVAVLDLDMPGADGLAAAEALRTAHPGCRVLILTGLPQPAHFLRALQAGVHGYLSKDIPADDLAEAVRSVAAGRQVLDPELVAAARATGPNPLTGREVEVLAAAADGGSTEEIGRALHLSPITVRNYLSRAIGKLDARNRADAIRIAREAGWLR
jgi:two-component system, NarL family, response regulator DesR